ncbi:hypothetical protein [Pseudomonas sp. RA_35y_Pfl2_P32]|uniref:hypothetical protein n=1 Tax=Pseudomonas sp. RA_35y_Pfl2_P32 TaxID=3088705 RepID=UPI0030DBC9FA
MKHDRLSRTHPGAHPGAAIIVRSSSWPAGGDADGEGHCQARPKIDLGDSLDRIKNRAHFASSVFAMH